MNEDANKKLNLHVSFFLMLRRSSNPQENLSKCKFERERAESPKNI